MVRPSAFNPSNLLIKLTYTTPTDQVLSTSPFRILMKFGTKICLGLKREHTEFELSITNYL